MGHGSQPRWMDYRQGAKTHLTLVDMVVSKMAMEIGHPWPSCLLGIYHIPTMSLCIYLYNNIHLSIYLILSYLILSYLI